MNNITMSEFTNLMNEAAQAWPNISNPARTKRIWYYAQSVPYSAFKQIVNDMLDHYSKQPIPYDFLKEINEWKSEFYKKNGYYWGYEKNTAVDENICKTCFDTGVLKVKHHNPDDFMQLMRCSCDFGAKVGFKLPRYSLDAAPMFVKLALRPEWFNPNLVDQDLDLDSLYGVLKAKHDLWAAIIKRSEDYWAGLGYIHA